MKTIITAVIALFMLTGHAMADDVTIPATVDARPTLELKGLQIGTSMTDVRAKFPGAECEVVGDGSISQCMVRDVTLADRPAKMLVRLLDDKVVYIMVWKMTQEDAYAAIDAMKVKFGRPDVVKQTRITLVRPERDRSLVYEKPEWRSQDGEQVLTIFPAHYTDKRGQFTYAGVALYSLHAHDDIWVKIFKNPLGTNDL